MATGFRLRGPVETNCPPTCTWQLVILHGEYNHTLLWITAWPLSVSPKNKPHAIPFLQSRDALWLLECGKCWAIVCICNLILVYLAHGWHCWQYEPASFFPCFVMLMLSVCFMLRLKESLPAFAENVWLLNGGCTTKFFYVLTWFS